MNVSVLAYVPVRSASLEAIGCLKLIVTGSLETGPLQVFSVVGAASRRRPRRPSVGAGGLQRLTAARTRR